VAIKISNLQQISDQFEQQGYYYSDLSLDFAHDTIFSTTIGKIIEKNDVKIDLNKQAIMNSLRNLFRTKPGQRFLFPLYGLNLESYLFEAVNENNARNLGDQIVKAIQNFEQRVRVAYCNVNMKPDEGTYDITIVVEIPILRNTMSINTLLDVKSQSFIFI